MGFVGAQRCCRPLRFPNRPSPSLLLQAAPSLTEQYEYAQSRGIPWLVIIHASTFGGELGLWGLAARACMRHRSRVLPALSAFCALKPAAPVHTSTHHSRCAAAADTVRVKAMGGRTEEDVSVPDLPAYLLSALHPHGSAPPPGARTPAAMRSGDDGDVAGEQDDTSAHGGRERERQRRGGRR